MSATRDIGATKLDQARLLVVGGQPVVGRSQVILRWITAQGLSERHARLLARPLVLPNEVRWRAPMGNAIAVKVSTLSPAARMAAVTDAMSLLDDLRRLSRTLTSARDGDSRTMGELLERVVEGPTEDDLFLVGEQPVLINWGVARGSIPPEQELIRMVSKLRATVKPPVQETPISGEVGHSQGFSEIGDEREPVSQPAEPSLDEPKHPGLPEPVPPKPQPVEPVAAVLQPIMIASSIIPSERFSGNTQSWLWWIVAWLAFSAVAVACVPPFLGEGAWWAWVALAAVIGSGVTLLYYALGLSSLDSEAGAVEGVPFPMMGQPIRTGTGVPLVEPLMPEPDRSLLDRLDSSVVLVAVVHSDGSQTGTGFVIGPGLVLTNHHVINGSSDKRIRVVSVGSYQFLPATVAAMDEGDDWLDLAVLRVPELASVPPLSLTLTAERATPVVSCGFPGIAMAGSEAYQRLLAGEPVPLAAPSVGYGIINAMHTNGSVVEVVHDAFSGPGASGGPLIDRCGRVIGVHTQGRSATSETSARAGIAIGAPSVKAFLDRHSIICPCDNSPCRRSPDSQSEASSVRPNPEERHEQGGSDHV